MELIKTNYFGGKSGSGTYQTIINQIPPHRHYIEAFGGMAGVCRKMKSTASKLLIEIDETLFETYQMLGFSELCFECYLEDRDNIKTPICINSNGFDLLHKEKYVFDRQDTFIYLDPPYPLFSRKSGPKYAYELTSREHYCLLLIIKTFKHAKIAISTYPNEMYSSMLSDWRMIEFESQTRHGKATEHLFMNYPEPTELQDYQYIGNDYRERERITRMHRRWQRKFKALSPIEQKAMLETLQLVASTNKPIGSATV